MFRQSRWAETRRINESRRLIIVALSFLESGWADEAPRGSREGDPLRDDQHQMVVRIERLIALWSGKETGFVPDILGRVTRKMQNVVGWFGEVLPLAAALGAQLDPYGRFRLRVPRPFLTVTEKVGSFRMKTVVLI